MAAKGAVTAFLLFVGLFLIAGLVITYFIIPAVHGSDRRGR